MTTGMRFFPFLYLAIFFLFNLFDYIFSFNLLKSFKLLIIKFLLQILMQMFINSDMRQTIIKISRPGLIDNFLIYQHSDALAKQKKCLATLRQPQFWVVDRNTNLGNFRHHIDKKFRNQIFYYFYLAPSTTNIIVDGYNFLHTLTI